MLLDLISSLRSLPNLQNTKIIFCPERNTGQTAGFLYKAAKEKFKNVAGLHFRNDRDPGWWTKPDDKYRFSNCAREAICEKRIFFMEDMVTGGSSVSDVKDKLFAQMRNFRLTPVGKTGRMDASGKYDSQGRKTNRDDLCLTFMMTTYILKVIMNGEVSSFYL